MARTSIVINLGVLLAKRAQYGLPADQKWLAAEADIAESTISDYARNKVRRADLDLVSRILSVLNQDLPEGVEPFGIGDFFVEARISTRTKKDEIPGQWLGVATVSV
jgi:hypothetical protein